MTIRIPAEWEPHACCWMAWAVHREWGKAVNKVKRELSEVVQTVARYEPVRLLAPRGNASREARREFSACSGVTVIEAPVDDIRMRDIVPTFALRGRGARQEVVAIDWNFNAWGATKARPPRPGDQLTKAAASIFAVPRFRARFVAEGGAFATDGRGTLVATRSCLLNPSRNPVRRGGFRCLLAITAPHHRVKSRLADGYDMAWVHAYGGGPVGPNMCQSTIQRNSDIEVHNEQ